MLNEEQINSENTVINNSGSKEPHPCQYCGTSCFGKQCKQCHLKMIEIRSGICQDCDKSFLAQRKDGSKRKRCFECQAVYNQKYISTCPFCKSDYHAYLDDGRVFDRCFPCYQSTFHKCERCDNKTKGEFNLCKSCYEQDRQNRYFSDNTTMLKCKNETCDNVSRYTFCKTCYDQKRIVKLYSIHSDE